MGVLSTQSAACRPATVEEGSNTSWTGRDTVVCVYKDYYELFLSVVCCIWAPLRSITHTRLCKLNAIKLLEFNFNLLQYGLNSKQDERKGMRLEASVFLLLLGKNLYKIKGCVCLTLQFHLRKFRQV